MLLIILILIVFRVSRKYEDEPCNTIDVNYVGRVVIRASH